MMFGAATEPSMYEMFTRPGFQSAGVSIQSPARPVGGRTRTHQPCRLKLYASSSLMVAIVPEGCGICDIVTVLNCEPR